MQTGGTVWGRDEWRVKGKCWCQLISLRDTPRILLLQERSWRQFQCAFGLHSHLRRSTNEQVGAVSFTGKADNNSPTPEERKLWLAWAGNSNQERWIGCTRQPAAPTTALPSVQPTISLCSKELIRSSVLPFPGEYVGHLHIKWKVLNGWILSINFIDFFCGWPQNHNNMMMADGHFS